MRWRRDSGVVADGVSRPNGSPRLYGEDLTLAYQDRVISTALDVAIPDRSFTVIVGPNACGKSTLLRALSRMLKPARGCAYLDGAAISSLPSKEVARRLGLLSQTPIAPDGITVADLVARGRYPHQGVFQQWSTDDDRVVAEAMAATGTLELAQRYVDELSGGQRQRVWVAMVLAQQTDIVLLDEPITFLDIAYQVEVLDLCARLHQDEGYTLVAVLHDLNHACRYATHLIAMREGCIVAQGPPGEIVNAELVEEVFGLACRVIDDPETGTPLVIPAAPGQTRPERKETTNGPPRSANQTRDTADTPTSRSGLDPAQPAPGRSGRDGGRAPGRMRQLLV